jgi:hypothetical protein
MYFSHFGILYEEKSGNPEAHNAILGYTYMYVPISMPQPSKYIYLQAEFESVTLSRLRVQLFHNIRLLFDWL